MLVITGDGEMLMGLGSLATIGVQQPANLSIVVIDNERYGETGMQTTHTAHGIDLAAVARGCGLKISIRSRQPCGKPIHAPAGAELRRDQGAGGEAAARAAAARRRAAQGALPPRLART